MKIIIILLVISNVYCKSKRKLLEDALLIDEEIEKNRIDDDDDKFFRMKFEVKNRMRDDEDKHIDEVVKNKEYHLCDSFVRDTTFVQSVDKSPVYTSYVKPWSIAFGTALNGYFTLGE